MNNILASQPFVVLDGGLGSELDTRGIPVGESSLWSAELVASNPDVLRDVHREYLEAGADVVTTASYQASIPGLVAYLRAQAGAGGRDDDAQLEARAAQLIEKSVQIAVEARDQFWASWTAAAKTEGRKERARPLVAASVGPYGAYLAQGQEYTGQYGLGAGEAAWQVLYGFHKPRLAALLRARPDVLAFETIPNVVEVQVLFALIDELAQSPPEGQAVPESWMAFSVDTANYACLADGTRLDDARVLGALPGGVTSVGANCLPLAECARTLEFLHRWFAQNRRSSSSSGHAGKAAATAAAAAFPLIVYPNSGEVYDGVTKVWHAPPKRAQQQQGGEHETAPLPGTLAEGARVWRDLGARLIGGCCRTRPADIRALRLELELEQEQQQQQQGCQQQG